MHHLESRVDKQRVQIHAVQVKTADYPAGAPGRALQPPVPWDKKFHLNGITITPGGFVAAEGVWRSRDTGGDFSPAFGSLDPYSSPLAHLNELRGTARQSRVSLLVQGNYNPDTLISGYGELDFLGAAPTANSNESNSYTPRIRHLYGTIDWLGEGVHLLAGQTWSLVTMKPEGYHAAQRRHPAGDRRAIRRRLHLDASAAIAPRQELRRPILDRGFGGNAADDGLPERCYFWHRDAGRRISRLPPSTATACIASNIRRVARALLNPYNYYSFNHIPDVIAKAALEENIAGHALHLEGYGLYTDLYDLVTNGVTGATVSYNNSRYDTTGWGAGGGFTLAVIPKLLDIQGSGMIGRGIGRYGSSQLANATFNPNGSLDPLPEAMVLGGAVLHATPQLDIYAYGGGEKILSTDWNSATGTGYVSPTADNSGCYILNGTCKGKVHDAWEITGGFWDKVYQGSFGSVRVGLQYAYIQDDLYPGSGGSQSGLAGGLPPNSQVHFNDQMVYASFRYYPFDPPPPAPPPVVAKY